MNLEVLISPGCFGCMKDFSWNARISRRSGGGGRERLQVSGKGAIGLEEVVEESMTLDRRLRLSPGNVHTGGSADELGEDPWQFPEMLANPESSFLG